MLIGPDELQLDTSEFEAGKKSILSQLPIDKTIMLSDSAIYIDQQGQIIVQHLAKDYPGYTLESLILILDQLTDREKRMWMTTVKDVFNRRYWSLLSELFKNLVIGMTIRVGDQDYVFFNKFEKDSQIEAEACWIKLPASEG